eukprot:6192796-Pleurochrysis_carterae.AAC.2
MRIGKARKCVESRNSELEQYGKRGIMSMKNKKAYSTGYRDISRHGKYGSAKESTWKCGSAKLLIIGKSSDNARMINAQHSEKGAARFKPRTET